MEPTTSVEFPNLSLQDDHGDEMSLNYIASKIADQIHKDVMALEQHPSNDSMETNQTVIPSNGIGYNDSDVINGSINDSEDDGEVTSDEEIAQENVVTKYTQASSMLEPKVTTCSVCGKYFARRHDLRRHMVCHTGEKPHKCSACGRCFGNPYSLDRHLRIHTGERPYNCKFCGKTFADCSNLKIHTSKHCPERPLGEDNLILNNDKRTVRFKTTADLPIPKSVVQSLAENHQGKKCPICTKEFRSPHDLQRHYLCHTGEKPHKCEQCGRRFANFYSMERHKRTHTGEKPYICQQCGKGFSDNRYLQMHLLDHTVGSSLHTIKSDLSAQTLHELEFSDTLLGESGPESEPPYMYTCTICAKMFPRRYDLKKHLVMHNTDRKFQCPECDQMFDFSPAFDAHLREHTGELAYRCTECGERFCDQSSLSNHKLQYSGTSHPTLLYNCELCSEQFKCVYDLQQHGATIHMNVKPFVCGFCSKAFYNAYTLIRHVKTHCGDQGLDCHICNEILPDIQTLKMHSLTHFSQKILKCRNCNETFSQPEQLKEHRKLHKTSNASLGYTCQVCGKKLSNSHNLKCHARIHTGEKPYQCKKCLMRFTFSYQLRRHNLNHSTSNNIVQNHVTVNHRAVDGHDVIMTTL